MVMIHPLFCHENGISFRRMEDSDLIDLLNLKNESWFGTHRITVANTCTQEKWFRSLGEEDVHTPRNLVLVGSEGENNVGVFKFQNIDWQNRGAEVGWDIYKDHRGRGLGKKLVLAGKEFAFRILNLHRLNAQILTTNKVSQRCAEAAGFTKEGFQRQAVWRAGQWVDNLIYGVLNE